MKLFLEGVYCIEEPQNPKAYQLQSVSTSEIFQTIQLYTSLFDQRNAQSFSKWCSMNCISFLKAKPDTNASSRRRKLYVLNEEYYGTLRQ